MYAHSLAQSTCMCNELRSAGVHSKEQLSLVRGRARVQCETIVSSHSPVAESPSSFQLDQAHNARSPNGVMCGQVAVFVCSSR